MAYADYKFPDYDTIVAEVNKIFKKFPDDKLTLRQIYYQLVAAMIIDNNIKAYKRLSEYLVRARETGDVDDTHIEDRARYIIGGDCDKEDPDMVYANAEEAFRNCWQYYARPMWEGQPEYVEVWIEKDALSRIVADVAEQWGVMTCVAKGYSSYTFINTAATRIMRACWQNKTVDDLLVAEKIRTPKILYFGDFDASGEDMVRDLGVRLERYGLVDGSTSVQKIALNREQIDQYHLPTAPAKGTDNRTKKFIEKHGDEVVELDSLDPDVLKALVQGAIVAHIDPEIWENMASESERERARIKHQVDLHFAEAGDT